MSLDATARPSPTLPVRSTADPLWMNRSNSLSTLSSGTPGPSSQTSMSTTPSPAETSIPMLEPPCRAAFEIRLTSTCLRRAASVATHASEPLRLTLRPARSNGVDRRRHHVTDPYRRHLDLDPGAVDAGRCQEVVDHPGHLRRFVGDDLSEVAHRVGIWRSLIGEDLGESVDRGQWSPELVREPGDELVLGTTDARARLRSRGPP